MTEYRILICIILINLVIIMIMITNVRSKFEIESKEIKRKINDLDMTIDKLHYQQHDTKCTIMHNNYAVVDNQRQLRDKLDIMMNYDKIEKERDNINVLRVSKELSQEQFNFLARQHNDKYRLDKDHELALKYEE